AGLQGLALEAGENAAFETRRPATLPIDEFRLRVEAFHAIAADLGQVAFFAGQIPWMLVFEVWVGIEHFTHLLCVVGPVRGQTQGSTWLEHARYLVQERSLDQTALVVARL